MKTDIFVLLIAAQIIGTCNSLPNIVVLLADDLGIGDVGCFGNDTIHTPNIDRLCHQGAKLTHHLSSAALCTPSRAAFLTGRYAIRMGMTEVEGSPPVVMYTSGKAGLPQEETTWAKMLQGIGYDTKAVGKWHLGWDDSSYGDQLHGPLDHGFNSFFGLPYTLVEGFESDQPFLTYSQWSSNKDNDDSPMHNHTMAFTLSLVVVMAVYSRDLGYILFGLIILSFLIGWFFLEHFALHTEKWWQRSLFMEKYLNSVLMRDREVAEQPINLNTLVDKLTSASVDFLKQKRIQPFALFHSFTNVHIPLVPSKMARGKSQHGLYGDSIWEMDRAVGMVLDTLDQLDIANNTLVYFASDHGSHIDLGRNGGSNGPFRGGKGMGALEGGIRVPGVIRWPQVVKPGTVIDAPTSLLDFLPTVAEITHQKETQMIDGKSYLKLLKGTTNNSPHTVLRHYCGSSLHAVRVIHDDGTVFKGYLKEPILNEEGHCGKGVLCPCFGDHVRTFERPQIYNLLDDPGEQKPLDKSSPIYEDIAEKVMKEFKLATSEEHKPSQYSSAFNVMPRPWMQPCAKFPFCTTNK